MRKEQMALLINQGLSQIEQAYKIEIRIAGKGHSSKAEKDRANALYYEGNDKIKQVLAALTSGELDKLPGKIGGNIR